MVSPLQSKKTVSVNNASTFRLLHKHFNKPERTVCGQLSPDAMHPRVSAAVIQILDLRVLYGGTVFGYLPRRLCDADDVSFFTEKVLNVFG